MRPFCLRRDLSPRYRLIERRCLVAGIPSGSHREGWRFRPTGGTWSVSPQALTLPRCIPVTTGPELRYREARRYCADRRRRQRRSSPHRPHQQVLRTAERAWKISLHSAAYSPTTGETPRWNQRAISPPRRQTRLGRLSLWKASARSQAGRKLALHGTQLARDTGRIGRCERRQAINRHRAIVELDDQARPPHA
jgi:hypothetical protein